MRIITKHLQKNKYTRSGIRLNSLKGLVIHWTNSATDNFSRDFEWLFQFLNVNRPVNEKYASYHYAIDQVGTVYELIPPTECAWHGGPSNQTDPDIEKQLGGKPNWNTLGICFLHPTPDGKPTLSSYNALVELCYYLIKEHKIPAQNLLRHHDCTGKNCPKYFVENQSEWNSFRRNVYSKLAQDGITKNTFHFAP